jgi:hypothetical protein
VPESATCARRLGQSTPRRVFSLLVKGGRADIEILFVDSATCGRPHHPPRPVPLDAWPCLGGRLLALAYQRCLVEQAVDGGDGGW